MNSCLLRLAMTLQQWLITIVYLPGEENSLADALSRQEWEEQEEDETAAQRQSGKGECEGPALTDEKEDTEKEEQDT